MAALDLIKALIGFDTTSRGSNLALIDFAEDLAGDAEGVERRRHAGIDRHLKEDLADFLAAQAVVERAHHMEFQFVRTIERGDHGEIDQRALFPVEPGPAPDIAPAIFGDELLQGPGEIVGLGERLAVDANAKFDRGGALRYAKALAPFKLRWFEEPCDPLDYALFAELASVYAPPLATGENLYSTQDVQNLIRFGGWRAGTDIIQVDPPQAYGIGE